MPSYDFQALNFDKLEFQPVASGQLSKEAIESLVTILFPGENLNVNMDESKLFKRAVKKMKSMKMERVLMLILHLDKVASISKRDTEEANEQLAEAAIRMSKLVDDCNSKLVAAEQTLRELDLSTEIIQHLEGKIEHQARRITVLEEEDKLSFLDQFNNRVAQAVNRRTDALQSRLDQEQELTRYLQRMASTVAARAQNEIGQDSVEEIKNQLTNVQAVLAEISRTVKEDRVSEAQSQVTDHGMQTVKANEWLATFMELHQKSVEKKKPKRASSGCIVM
jgi:hypothetical protein